MVILVAIRDSLPVEDQHSRANLARHIFRFIKCPMPPSLSRVGYLRSRFSPLPVFFLAMAGAFKTMASCRMKLFKNSFVNLSLAALSCLLVSCANPISTLVQDTVRAPFVALGATTTAVSTVPYAVSSTTQSLSNTYNQLGPNAQKTLAPTVTQANNSTAKWTN